MNRTEERRILVTAFEPFGGDGLNPTEMALEKLPEKIGGFSVRKLVLPVEFVHAREIAFAAYDALLPAAVLMFGQAGGRSAVTPEKRGKNLMDARIPDNAGFMPKGLPVVPGGPEFLPSTFSAERIAEALLTKGIPAECSDDAGTFVCNTLLYGMLGHIRGAVPAGFIHVPYVREQAHADKPFLELGAVVRAMAAAVETVAEELKEKALVSPSLQAFINVDRYNEEERR